MNSRKPSHLRRIGIAIALTASALAGPIAAARAAEDPLAGIPATLKDYDEFPLCSATVTSFCVKSFMIDMNNDGVFEVPPATLPVKFTAQMFSMKDWNTPSLSWQLWANGQQELHPVIPVGTPASFEVNTGAFKPTPSLFTEDDVVSFDVSQVDGNWITQATVKTTSYVFALNCENDGCRNPKSQRDYISTSQSVLFYEKPTPTSVAKHGMWVSTNASVTGELVFAPSTMTWSIDLAAPAKKLDGTPNEIRYRTFIPDTFIQFGYGTTADVLASALKLTRTDMDITTEVSATITRVLLPRPGLLISLPDIRMYGTVVKKSVQSMGVRYMSAPTLKISPRAALLKAPTLLGVKGSSQAKTARVTARGVYGATKYQAMCSNSNSSVFATAKSPTVTVKDLPAGKWTCQIRGVKKLGGRWSARKSITLS